MKKSVALFLTLVFVISVIIIIGSVFALYEKFSDNTFYKKISQNSVIIRDINKSLFKLSDKINEKNIKYIFTSFLISSNDGNFRALITIIPLTNRVNINEVYKNRYAKKYLQNILEYYQVLDPIFLENLILDTIDLDKNERLGGSEIVLKNPFFKQGKIYNYTHLKQILDYYFNITKDKKIYKIPWRKLFVFGYDSSIIDCNLISKDSAKFLGLHFNSALSCKSLNEYEENKKIMQNLNIISYNKNVSYPILINVKYDTEELNITYDLNQKRIKDIKSNILY